MLNPHFRVIQHKENNSEARSVPAGHEFDRSSGVHLFTTHSSVHHSEAMTRSIIAATYAMRNVSVSAHRCGKFGGGTCRTIVDAMR
jgi:hypothetical protein